jgi:hypothetical protein
MEFSYIDNVELGNLRKELSISRSQLFLSIW